MPSTPAESQGNFFRLCSRFYTILTQLIPGMISSVSSESRTNAPYGLRLRALLVALPLLVGICFISVYSGMVVQKVQMGVLQMAPPAVVALLMLALVNRGGSVVEARMA